MFWWHTFAMIRRQMPQTPFPEKGNIIFLPWLWSRSTKNDILKNCFWKRQILKKSISVGFLMSFSFAIFRSNLSTWIVTLLRWEIDVYEKPCRGKHQSAQNKWGHSESFSESSFHSDLFFYHQIKDTTLSSLNTWCFIRGAPRVTP